MLRKFFIILLTLGSLLIGTFLANSVHAADSISIAGVFNEYQVNPATSDQLIKVSISLLRKPGNSVTVRSSLDGTVSGITIKSGANLVFTTANYSTSQTLVIVVTPAVTAGKTSILTLQGSGITTQTAKIQVVAPADIGTPPETKPTDGGTTPTKTEDTSISTLQSLIPGSNITISGEIPVIISYFFVIIALCAFASLVYSGFLYITAGGDTGQVEKARKNITWAIIGVIIALLSYVIVLVVPALISGGLNRAASSNPTTTPLSYQLTDRSGNAISNASIGDATRTDFSTNVCVKLAAQPATSLGINVSTDGNLPLVLDASQISITPDNWATPQCVSVSYKGDGQPGQNGEVIIKYAQDTAERLVFSVN